jgi:hypothetical protein
MGVNKGTNGVNQRSIDQYPEVVVASRFMDDPQVLA